MIRLKKVKYNQIFNRYKSFDKNATALRYEKKLYNQEIIKSNHSNFHIILPPPNVTGKLHLGHALTITIEDALVRFAKFNGSNPIWYPGFDHAGIATQTVVEKQLWKEKKLLRSNLNKEEFLKYCEEWKNKKIHDIQYQIKKLTPLINWEHTYYTMEDKFSHGVNSAFIDLYNKNFIYRDKRTVNWCSSLKSVISDQEVIRELVNGGDCLSIPDPNGGKKNVKFGRLFRVKYKIVDSSEYIEIETSRPETIFADVAVAVNPNDDRYNHLIGKYVENPLIDGIYIQIVSNENVKIDFGSGMLKLTPSHSQTDYKIVTDLVEKDILKKNVLNISCIDDNGCIICPVDKKWNGMDKFDAREDIINYLASKGLLKETTPSNYKTEIPICERSGNVVQSVLKSQWFMKTERLQNDIKEYLMKGKIQLLPEFHNSNLIHWLSNTEPWCLSRQINWGHQIPAYKYSNNEEWIVGHPEDKNIKYSVFNLERDSDVLDTWFSSSLIPIIINGWPNKKVHNKLNFIETGHDILGFWISRMLTVCYGITGQLPFDKILLHGLVRDSMGRKMSKSLGNVIDPLDIIDGITLNDMKKRIKESALNDKEIKIAEENLSSKYPEGINGMGADALRYALLRHDVTSLDINVNLLETASEGYHFCNKVYNIMNFAKQYFENIQPGGGTIKSSDHFMDSYIKSRLRHCLNELQYKLIENFQPNAAFLKVCSFILQDLSMFYMEIIKVDRQINDIKRLEEISLTLYEILITTFRVLSIFMPQVSDLCLEELENCHFIDSKYVTVNVADFEVIKHSFTINEKSERCGELLLLIISHIRKIRESYKISKTATKLEGTLILDKSQYNDDNINSLNQIIRNHNINFDCKIIDKNDINTLSLDKFVPFELCPKDATLYINIPKEYLKKFSEDLSLKKEKLLKKKEKYIKLSKDIMEDLDNPTFKANNNQRDKLNKRMNTFIAKAKAIDIDITKFDDTILDIKNKMS